jgi:hypothetical protein
MEPSEDIDSIISLIVSRRPRVILFDLAPPYKRSASVFFNLRDRFRDRSFILTCADPILAIKNAPRLSGYPVFQKPYEIDEVAKVAQSMVYKPLRRVFAAPITVS